MSNSGGKYNYKIDLGSSDFRSFIEKDLLYVDKTLFIEHVLENPSTVLLFTRPRRMGKTLNLRTLEAFLDPKVSDSKELFRGLNIEKSPVYNKINSHPVIWMSFRDFAIGDKRVRFYEAMQETAQKYLKPEEYGYGLKNALKCPNSEDLTTAVRYLCKDITKATNMKPVVLIDEYDKLYMDGAKEGGKAYDEAAKFTKDIMASCLKDNPFLEKGVITGVNRIAQESMFSDLNNIKVIGVFNKSEFDEDFGLTEEEVAKLVHTEDLDKVRSWYNGFRVGNHLIYFTYSVMAYLESGEFSNYWGQSGTIDLIKEAITPERIENISKTVANGGFITNVIDRITGTDLNEFRHDEAFYSLLVQTGYLTHNRVNQDDYISKSFELNTPNVELEFVWKSFILSRVYDIPDNTIYETFRALPNLDRFSLLLNQLLNNKLSYFDFESQEPEKTYHVYVAGLFAAAGYKFKSNREAGRGRYDILLQTDRDNFIFEFKKASDSEHIQEASTEAIKQIRDKNYASEIENLSKTYLIGIGFCGSNNWVEAVEL